VRGKSVLGLGASQEANRTGRKGLPRFAPLLYIRQEIYCISRFIYVTLVTHGISAVQSHLQLHFSKYFLLGSIDIYGQKLSNGGSCFFVELPTPYPLRGLVWRSMGKGIGKRVAVTLLSAQNIITLSAVRDP